MWWDYRQNKIDTDNIVVDITDRQNRQTQIRSYRYWGIKKILGLLRITEGYASDRNRTIEISIDKVSILLAITTQRP